MTGKTRSVSLEADKTYVSAVGTLAKSRDKTIGRLVREAMDQVYGVELNKLISDSAIFFADNGNKKNHS